MDAFAKELEEDSDEEKRKEKRVESREQEEVYPRNTQSETTPKSWKRMFGGACCILSLLASNQCIFGMRKKMNRCKGLVVRGMTKILCSNSGEVR